MRLLSICCAILLTGAVSHITLAHGGGVVQVADAPAGPYLVTIWTSPSTARAGRALHLTIGINEMRNGTPTPVLDASVSVELTPIDAVSSTLTAQATTEQSVNKLLYETDVTITEPGGYSVNLLIAGPAGEGTTSFSIAVEPKRSANWPVFALTALGLFMTFLLLRLRSGVRSGTPARPFR